jgi:Mg-chelatase subunit ChlD
MSLPDPDSTPAPRPMRSLGDSTIAGLLAGRPKPSCWRIVMQQRELPLNLRGDEAFFVGSADTAGLQLTHHSVKPTHCAFSKDGAGLVLRAAAGAAVAVDGVPVVRPTALKGGEKIRIGELELRLECGAVATPVVRRELEFSSEQEFYRLLRRELARAPWFLISLAAHAACFLLLFDRDDKTKPAERLISLTSQIVDANDAVQPPPVPPSPFDHRPETVLEQAELPDLEPELVAEPVEEPNFDEPLRGIEEPTSSGLGAAFGKNDGGGFVRGPGIKLSGMDKGLAKTVGQFRDGGLDLVVLIDTTASMDSLIESSRRAIDKVITDFGSLVPSLQIGMIAYRDQDDAYLTRVQGLTDDRYRILNFLETLEAGGGGDTPEAVFEAIRVAFKELEWRPNSYRALLVVGDAPPHEKDEPKLYQLLRDETGQRKERAFVSTICVANPRNGYGKQEIDRVVDSFRQIARVGHGEFLHLEDTTAVGDEFISTVVGRNHRDAILAALKQSKNHLIDDMLKQKVRERDLPWLLAKFGKGRVEPELVNALIKLHSHTVAQRCLAIVRADGAARQQREAALFILRRSTGYDGNVDFDRPIASQQVEVDRLHDSIRKIFGALEPLKPKPPRR